MEDDFMICLGTPLAFYTLLVFSVVLITGLTIRCVKLRERLEEIEDIRELLTDPLKL